VSEWKKGVPKEPGLYWACFEYVYDDVFPKDMPGMVAAVTRVGETYCFGPFGSGPLSAFDRSGKKTWHVPITKVIPIDGWTTDKKDGWKLLPPKKRGQGPRVCYVRRGDVSTVVSWDGSGESGLIDEFVFFPISLPRFVRRKT